MPTEKFAAICSKKHLQSAEDDPEELTSGRYCQKCGSGIHHVCPNCSEQEALLRITVRKRDDGSAYWTIPDHCHRCGESYPWVDSKWKRKLKSVANDLANADPSPTPSGIVLTQDRCETLEETAYGNEVLEHVRDGDSCYRKRLWHPAMVMYIHAYEWLVIAYLKDREGVDIIDREQKGQEVYYSLAGRSPSLIDELTNHIDLDQKTISRIESMNRAERRWMAHHKSGETLKQDVDAVRARLAKLLGTLFDD